MNSSFNQPLIHPVLRNSQSRKSSQLSQRNQITYYNKKRCNLNEQFYVCKSRPKTQPKYKINTNLPIYIVQPTKNNLNFNKQNASNSSFFQLNSKSNINNQTKLNITSLQSTNQHNQGRNQQVRQEMDLCLYTAIDKLKQLNSNQIQNKRIKMTFSQARINKIINQRNDKSIHRIQPQLLNKYIQTVYKQYEIDNPFTKTSIDYNYQEKFINFQNININKHEKYKDQTENKIKYLKQQKNEKRTGIITRKRQQKKFINMTLSKQKDVKAKKKQSPKANNNINKLISQQNIIKNESPIKKQQKTFLQIQNKNKSLSKSSKKIKQLKENISNNQEQLQNLNYYEKSPYQLLSRTDNITISGYKQEKTKVFQDNSIQVRSMFFNKEGEVQPQFRFCLLCEEPILSININKHQKNCIGYHITDNKKFTQYISFVNLYRMTEIELKKFLAFRIAQIRQRIEKRIKNLQNIEIGFKGYSEQVCQNIVKQVQNYLTTTMNLNSINETKMMLSHSQVIKTANNQYFKILDDVTKLHWFIKIYDNYSGNKSYFKNKTSKNVQSIYQKRNNDSTRDRRYIQSINSNTSEQLISDFKIRQSLIQNKIC